MSLHPEVEKMIEAGPHKTPLVHNGCTIDHIYETPEEFARRCVEFAVEKEREAIRKIAADWMLSVENCEDAVRWQQVGGAGNAVSGAMNKLQDAIRRRGKP